MKSKKSSESDENHYGEDDENDNDSSKVHRKRKRNPKRNRTQDENGDGKKPTTVVDSNSKPITIDVDDDDDDDDGSDRKVDTSSTNNNDEICQTGETNETNPKRKEEGMKNHPNDTLDNPQMNKKMNLKGQKQKQDHDEKHSMEALLSIPLKYILRKTSKGRNQHQQLLSKTEATAFLQISNLAYELDILVQMATSALYKSHLAKQLSSRITPSPSSPYSYYHYYLQPIHVLLKIHGETIPHQILQHVQTNMERILLVEFPVLSQILHQSSEQNWSVSNALDLHQMDTVGDDSDESDDDDETKHGSDNHSGGSKKKKKKRKNNVNQLGREKGILAELEEEVCKRMNGLIEMANMNHQCVTGGSGVGADDSDNKMDMDVDVDDTTDADIFDLMTAPKYKKEEGDGCDDDDKQFMSMARLCRNLFSDDDTENGLQHEFDDGK